MKINAVLTGCTLYKNREIALFAFSPLEGPGESVFGVLLDGRWLHHELRPDWAAIGMAAAKYPGADDWVIVATSSEGRLWELIPGTKTERELEIPGDREGITRLASIGDAVWACGMGRLVLRREADGSWTDVSAPEPDLDEGVIGFTALAGSPDGGVVAVGWNGEIWLRAGDAWAKEDAKTDANLNAVSVRADGEIVAVGDDGTIVRGRRNAWSARQIGTGETLQGVCHFGDEIFICSDTELFCLEANGLAEETRFAGDPPGTCMNLYASQGVVLSQGEKQIYRLEEGIWSRVF